MADPAIAVRESAVARAVALAALVDAHASPGGARVRLGPPRAFYAPVWDELQGFARPLFAVAALAHAGDGHRLPAAHWHRLRRGLAAGSDPDHPEWWGWIEDRGQGCCEVPAVALALVWARRELWDPLPGAVRDRLAAWIRRLTVAEVHPNNWLWFRILARLALARLGDGLDRRALAHDLAAVRAFAADGWALDGRRDDQRTADWYVPMALGVYPLLAAELLADHDPAAAAVLRADAAALAGIARRTTAGDGAPLAWGRSLAYRRASASLWAAYAWADLEALPWSEIAWHWRAQQGWWDRREPLGGDGGTAIGYAYANDRVGESYICATAPLWWCKSLLALRRPASHPFWAGPAPAPPPLPPATVPGAGLVVRGGCDPLLLTVGQYGPGWMAAADARYRRWAYDAHAGFLIPAAGEGPFPDNALLVDAGDGWRGRGDPPRFAAEGAALVESWSPCPGVAITTRLVLHQDGHRRDHTIVTDRPLRLREGGFPAPPERRRHGPGRAEVSGAGLRSRIVAADGRHGAVWDAPDGAGLIHPRCAVPVLEGELPPGTHRLASQVRAVTG